MYLLTWHGTIVCVSVSNGRLTQSKVPLSDATVYPVDLNIAPNSFVTTEAVHHVELGKLNLVRALGTETIHVLQDSSFLCAEDNGSVVSFSRKHGLAWETFMLLTHQNMRDLDKILKFRWIVAKTRQVIRLSQIRLLPGFTLQIGQFTIDLPRSLAGMVVARGQNNLPIVLQAYDQDSSVRIVVAEPRSSALIETAFWPVRSRRVAEILALAVHRQVLGTEPTQDEFEKDVTFLKDRLGPPGLEDLLERKLPLLKPNEFRSNARSDHLTGSAGEACALISLGTSCIVACTLRRLTPNSKPMPFDWLTTTPAMIRHCIETDFAVLLNPEQFVSLTGKASPGEPERGCDHLFYREFFGCNRVFNHNDPTSEVDLRYTQVTVDRFRDVLESTLPKIFIQCRQSYSDSLADFEKTVVTLESRTTNFVFLQFEVAVPNRRLAAPLLSITANLGPHIFYLLKPTSHMRGEFFDAENDARFFEEVISRNARGPGTSQAARAANAAAISEVIRDFSPTSFVTLKTHRPSDLLSENVANDILQEFLWKSGLPTRFRIGTYDSSLPNHDIYDGVWHVDISDEITELSFPDNFPPSLASFQRVLSLVFQLDTLIAIKPLRPINFIAEIGDCSYMSSVSFCSNAADSCLIPDPDFIASNAYAETKKKFSRCSSAWVSRTNTVFWRGSTTGKKRDRRSSSEMHGDFDWLPRLDLCSRVRASSLSRYYDVGISNIVQIDDPALVARIQESGLCKAPVEREAFLSHKAILVIDGNSNAWSALFCALLTGSCVFLVESPLGYRQWYYDALQPWLHYVPVSSSLEDLDSRTSWMLENDAAAQVIGEQGRLFAESITLDSAMLNCAGAIRDWLSAADRNVAYKTQSGVALSGGIQISPPSGANIIARESATENLLTNAQVSALARIAPGVDAISVADIVIESGFDPVQYVHVHPDLLAANLDSKSGLFHYLAYGFREHRTVTLKANVNVCRLRDLVAPRVGKSEYFRDLYISLLLPILIRKQAISDGCSHLNQELVAFLSGIGCTTFFIIGDSHSQQYNRPVTHGEHPIIPLPILCSAGSAMGLAKISSRSGYGAMLLDWASTAVPKLASFDIPILFKFGQVDVEFAWTFTRIDKGIKKFSFEQFKSFASRSVNQYESFLRNMVAIVGSQNLRICSIFPPVLSDASWAEGYVNAHVGALESNKTAEELRRGIQELEIPDFRTRTELHRFYNGLLCQMCRRLRLQYVDDFETLLGREGVLDERFRNSSIVDHHIDFVAAEAIMTALIEKVVIKPTVPDALKKQ